MNDRLAYTHLSGFGWVKKAMSNWWQCSNDPPCAHGAVLHDINECDDPLPRCTVDGCDCGAVAGSVSPTGDDDE